jgi:hypothetical protein
MLPFAQSNLRVDFSVTYLTQQRSLLAKLIRCTDHRLNYMESTRAI